MEWLLSKIATENQRRRVRRIPIQNYVGGQLPEPQHGALWPVLTRQPQQVPHVRLVSGTDILVGKGRSCGLWTNPAIAFTPSFSIF